ncbi:FMN-binding protein [Winogradskyella sp.]|uniref:FMN-binding protein n=1 Tax=Winogradskyella sp. TaxID=1883156 RepID=UPI0025D1410B|nr:FMN-binding protein [Winogradskyella sp.]
MKVLSIIILILSIASFSLPKKIQKKVDSEIKKTYYVDTFSFNAKTIDSEIAKELPSAFGVDNFFEIKKDSIHLGYAYVSKAPSKTDQFDYLVLLDKNLVIVKAKVLIYREDYGGEIGSKRWLKQYIGKSKDNEFRYGDNIDAISGATISVRSMTNAMNDLMKSLKILNEKGIL